MKKLIALLMAVIMCISFTACGQSTDEKMVAYVIAKIIKSDEYRNALVLENAWCDTSTGEVVVCVDGDATNDKTGIVKCKYKYYKNGNFMLRKINPSSDVNSYYEEESKRLLEITQDSSLKLSKSSVNRIYHLYEENKLDNIEYPYKETD